MPVGTKITTVVFDDFRDYASKAGADIVLVGEPGRENTFDFGSWANKHRGQTVLITGITPALVGTLEILTRRFGTNAIIEPAPGNLLSQNLEPHQIAAILYYETGDPDTTAEDIQILRKMFPQVQQS